MLRATYSGVGQSLFAGSKAREASLAESHDPYVPSGTVSINDPGDVYDTSTVSLTATVTGDTDTLVWRDGASLIGSVAAGSPIEWEVDGTGDHTIAVEGYAGAVYLDGDSLVVTVLEETPPATITIADPGAVYEGVATDGVTVTPSGDTDRVVLTCGGADPVELTDPWVASWTPGVGEGGTDVTITAVCYAGATVVDTVTRTVSVGTLLQAWNWATGVDLTSDARWAVWVLDARHCTITSNAIENSTDLAHGYVATNSTSAERPPYSATAYDGIAPGAACAAASYGLYCTDAAFINAHKMTGGVDPDRGLFVAVQQSATHIVHTVAGFFAGNGASVFELRDAAASGYLLYRNTNSITQRGGTFPIVRPIHMCGQTTGTSYGCYNNGLPGYNHGRTLAQSGLDPEVFAVACRHYGSTTDRKLRGNLGLVVVHPPVDQEHALRMSQLAYRMGYRQRSTAFDADAIDFALVADSQYNDSEPLRIERAAGIAQVLAGGGFTELWHIGDIFSDSYGEEGDAQLLVDTFEDVAITTGTGAPLWRVLPGNHDITRTSVIQSVFSGSQAENESGELYGHKVYTINGKTLLYVWLDSNAADFSAQTTFLSNTLAAYATSCDNIVVAWHMRFLPLDGYNTNDATSDKAIPWAQLCEQYNVCSVLGGHTHIGWSSRSLVNGVYSAGTPNTGTTYRVVPSVCPAGLVGMGNATLSLSYAGPPAVTYGPWTQANAWDNTNGTGENLPWTGFATITVGVDGSLTYDVWSIEGYRGGSYTDGAYTGGEWIVERTYHRVHPSRLAA